MVGSKRGSGAGPLNSKALEHRENSSRLRGAALALRIRVLKIRFCGFKTHLQLFFDIGIWVEGIDEAVVAHDALTGCELGRFPQGEELWERRATNHFVAAHNLVGDHSRVQVPLVLNTYRAPCVHKGN